MCGQKDKICVGLFNPCEYLCHKWPRICFVCRNHNPVLHSWFFTGFVTRVPRRVPLVELELLTLKRHLSSPLVFVRFMLLNLVSCVVVCRSLFVLFLLVIIWSVFWLLYGLSFGHYMVCLLVIIWSVFWLLYGLSFGHYMVCRSTNGLWVFLRYLKTVLTSLTLYICLCWTLFYIEKQYNFTSKDSFIVWELHPVIHFHAVTPKFHTVTDDIFTYILNMP
jgi:hypothetical protein